MTLVAPRRDEELVEGNRSTIRFATFLEDTATDVNDAALNFPPVTVQDGSYTFDLEDANSIVLNQEGVADQKYTIPAFSDVVYTLGTYIEIYNDTALDLSVGTTAGSDDTLEDTTAGLTTGARTIASGGWARIRLIDVDTVTWKMTGDQIS